VTSSAPGRAPIICDLDGVIWLSLRAIPGAADAITRLRASGHRILFVTNNSFLVREDVEAALRAVGVPAEGDVLSSAMAAAGLVQPGERAFVVGGPGIVQALEARGVEVVHEGTADAVIVGFTREFDYDALRQANATIRAGARLIGTNDDATYPTPDGPIPGGGALLAAVAKASGRVPLVAGKPYQPMADLLQAELGGVMDGAVMVGDRPETDGDFAAQLGIAFALVRSGVTPPGVAVEPVPAFDAPDLAALVEDLLTR
jgi:4-nitrophenyl phosphatase